MSHITVCDKHIWLLYIQHEVYIRSVMWDFIYIDATHVM